MPEKDPSTYTALTYLWVVVLAMWGGVISFVQRVKLGHTKVFNFMEFLGEVATSGFVGVITFWLCEAAGINHLITAALVGITGHMGSRAIWRLEKWAEHILYSERK